METNETFHCEYCYKKVTLAEVKFETRFSKATRKAYKVFLCKDCWYKPTE